MKSCWKFMPEERPQFSELAKSIDHLKSVLHNKPVLKKASAESGYLPISL